MLLFDDVNLQELLKERALRIQLQQELLQQQAELLSCDTPSPHIGQHASNSGYPHSVLRTQNHTPPDVSCWGLPTPSVSDHALAQSVLSCAASSLGPSTAAGGVDSDGCRTESIRKLNAQLLQQTIHDESDHEEQGNAPGATMRNWQHSDRGVAATAASSDDQHPSSISRDIHESHLHWTDDEDTFIACLTGPDSADNADAAANARAPLQLPKSLPTCRFPISDVCDACHGIGQMAQQQAVQGTTPASMQTPPDQCQEACPVMKAAADGCNYMRYLQDLNQQLEFEVELLKAQLAVVTEDRNRLLVEAEAWSIHCLQPKRTA
eukprot:jgi/Chrzof1/4810/Cz15g00070.t1